MRGSAVGDRPIAEMYSPGAPGGNTAKSALGGIGSEF
jgi:hypothetical protein